MKIYVELNSKTNKIVDLYESLKDIMAVHSEDKYVYFALANAVYHKSNYKGYNTFVLILLSHLMIMIEN